MSTSSIKRQIRRFHVVVVQWTSKECTKKRDAPAELLFWSLNLLFFWSCRRRSCLGSLMSGSEKNVNRNTYHISSIKRVTKKFLEVSRCSVTKKFLKVSRCSRAKQRQRNVKKGVLHVQSFFFFLLTNLFRTLACMFCFPNRGPRGTWPFLFS